MNTENILGYHIMTETKDRCIGRIMDGIYGREKRKVLVCANPHSLEVARRDPLFDEALKSADFLIPDGVGIVIASKINRGRIKDRITGSDVFQEVSSALNERRGYRYFFLGSTEDNLRCIREKMSNDFPCIDVAGTYSPPFREDFDDRENGEMVAAINTVKPHVLWVGMTAPRQEKWIHLNRRRLDVSFIAAVGAVFDFYTGRVKRSHPVFRSMGLEWLPRLVRDPVRLWRRNFVSNPKFLIRVTREVVRTNGARESAR